MSTDRSPVDLPTPLLPPVIPAGGREQVAAIASEVLSNPVEVASIRPAIKHRRPLPKWAIVQAQLSSNPALPTQFISGVHLHLFKRPVYQEKYDLGPRKPFAVGRWSLDARLMSGGHALRYQFGDAILTELITPPGDRAPADGVVLSFACDTEHDHEQRFPKERVAYSSSSQPENLRENHYRTTFDEMLEYIAETKALSHRWTDKQGRQCLSVLDIQPLPKEVHCLGFHLLAQDGYVLRTQTVFSYV